jgi:hypothetical protein
MFARLTTFSALFTTARCPESRRSFNLLANRWRDISSQERAVTSYLRRWFWIEMSLALLTVGLALATLVWRGWIEIVFRVDPDQGSGFLEWTIVCAALACTLSCTFLAGHEWRRAKLAATGPA